MKIAILSLFAFVSLFISQAHAYDVVSSPFLTGDWGGKRTELSQEGVDVILGYGSEIGHNFSGGTSQMTDYTDQWVFGADVDFEKLGWWKGGEFVGVMSDRNGNNLGSDANIGNDMLLQEVYGRGQTLHLTKFWYNQKFFDNRLEWKLGRMLAGEDFAAFSCDFQNLSFCGSPPGNLVGGYWINWPTSVWGTRLKFHTTAETAIQIGALQDNPTYVDDKYAQKYGWTLDNPGGSRGTLIPAEFDWTPAFDGHGGMWRIGGWYDTTLVSDIANPNSLASQWGYYVSVEQLIDATKTSAGFSVFFNFTQADPATAAVDRQIAIGTEYHGPFARIHDFIGLALGDTNNSPRYAYYMNQQNVVSGTGKPYGSGDEYDAEIFYSYSPIASIYLRPNLQYVLQPGGTSANANAFVGGLKSGVAF